MGEPVIVPEHVFHGLEIVRQSGKTNMYMTQWVQHWAYEVDEDETAEWLDWDENRKALVRGISAGIEPDSGNGREIRERVRQEFEAGHFDFLEEE